MKLKRLTACLLLSACTLTGCLADNSGGVITNTPTAPTVGGVINESTTLVHKVDGTLHDIKVDFNKPVSNFVVNGQTDYKVIIKDSKIGQAAGLIVNNVFKATGAMMASEEITDSIQPDSNTRYIIIGCLDKYEEMGGIIPSYETIGVAGYRIETIGTNVFINAYSEHGYQLGAIAFLREVLGYDMLAEDCVVFENKGEKMPKIDITERPDFDFRQHSNGISSTEQYGMGYTVLDPIINTGESWVHNWYDFVSLEEADANPDWASNDSTRWQGCWTTRGNKESFEGLVDHMANKMIKYLKQWPERNTIIVGQHDIGTNTPSVQNCNCTSCQASYQYYGTMAGAFLSLCNRVSVKVDEYLQTEEAIEYFGGVKDWNLLELVYHTSVNPPVEKDNSGNYKLTDEGVGIPKQEMWFNPDGSMEAWETAWSGDWEEEGVIKEWTESETRNQNPTEDGYGRIYSAPNLHFMFAASAADYTHSFYETNNASWKSCVDGWGGVGGDFFVWLYALNSEGLLYPYNSFDTEFETTRYFKNLGAKYVFWQCQYENKNNAGFTKLRVYLNSKVNFNVNYDYQYYVDKFFKHYYGDAGEIMQRYFEEVQAQCRFIESEYTVAIGNIHNKKYTDNKENWPEGLMKSWLNTMSDAHEVVELKYKNTDPVKYESYKKHIMIEELFPTYVLCTLHTDSYTASELKKLRQDFLTNFYALDNKNWGEGRLMSSLTANWDLE